MLVLCIYIYIYTSYLQYLQYHSTMYLQHLRLHFQYLRKHIACHTSTSHVAHHALYSTVPQNVVSCCTAAWASSPSSSCTIDSECFQSSGNFPEYFLGFSVYVLNLYSMASKSFIPFRWFWLHGFGTSLHLEDFRQSDAVTFRAAWSSHKISGTRPGRLPRKWGSQVAESWFAPTPKYMIVLSY